MGNLQDYEPIDPSLLDELDEEMKKAGSNRFLKLEVGATVVRFLPPQAGRTKAFKLVHEHYVDVPGRQNAIRFACPRQMLKGKERCPACEEADALERTGNPVDKERAKRLRPNAKIYANVIDRERPEEGPKILAFGKKVWEQLKGIIEDTREGGDVTNPGPKGFDIIITREGTGKNDTKYTVRPARNDSALGSMEWIEKQWNLDEYAQVPVYQDLIALMKGEDPREVKARRIRAGDDSDSGRGRDRGLADGRVRGGATEEPRGRRRSAQDDAIDADYKEAESDDDIPL